MNSEMILVVDDDPRWCNLFQLVLEGYGYSFKIVDNYDAALFELKRRYYPVIVTDLRLLGETDNYGLQLINDINTIWPSESVCKILVSAYPLSPKEVQQIFHFNGRGPIFFISKGGDDGKGFNSLIFASTVSFGLIKVLPRVRCFLHKKGECSENIVPKIDQIFVAMPYSLNIGNYQINQDEVYNDGIVKPLSEIGLTAIRADEKPPIGALMCNVCKLIQESSFCIADITNWNPNVLFELGLMLGLGKISIIIKRKGEQMITDLKFSLFLEYDGNNSLADSLKSMIKILKKL